MSATKSTEAFEQRRTAPIGVQEAPKPFSRGEDLYRALYEASPGERIQRIREGVSARDAKGLLDKLEIGQIKGFSAFRIARATVNRKASLDQRLSHEESERVIGVAKLVGQVETMVAQSGDPSGFDAAAWLGRWMQEPTAALGGACPLEFMDTMEGQALVSDTLARAQSGAYG